MQHYILCQQAWFVTICREIPEKNLENFLKKNFGRSYYGLKVLHLVVASDKVNVVFACLDELKIILFLHIHRIDSSSLRVGGIIFCNYQPQLLVYIFVDKHRFFK